MSHAITVTSTGDFHKITGFLERAKQFAGVSILDKYGKMGVEALEQATPKDTGTTASMWRYEIQNSDNGVSLEFHNDNIVQNVNIAIILQYGHGTGTGGWVQGRDYINPAIQEVFDNLASELWKEVTKV